MKNHCVLGFRLLLVEFEEFNNDGLVFQIVYYKPQIFDTSTFYKIDPRGYIIIGRFFFLIYNSHQLSLLGQRLPLSTSAFQISS